MNLDLLVQRLLGRPTCLSSRSTKFLASARIRNINGKNESISIGGNTVIAGEVLTFKHGGRVTIGEWCFLGENSRIWSASDVSIGDRVLISHGVNIFDSLTHPISKDARHLHFKSIFLRGHPLLVDLDEKPIVIGNDVWIGANSIILKGVHLGNGSVVGAGSVVTKNVPANVIVAGNPAKVVRKISLDEQR